MNRFPDNKRKYRIMYVLHRFDQAGSQNSLLAHAVSMKKLGHTVLFVGSKGLFEKNLLQAGCEYETRPFFSFSPLSLIGAVKLAYIIQKFKPDIIHSNNYWPHIECLYMKALFGIPVVSTFPGGPYFDKPIIPDCPIISYSAELKDAIVKKRGNKFADILVIRNRFDLSLIAPSEKNLPQNSKTNSFIMIGRLDRDKEASILTFINMIKNLRIDNPNITGFILGGGNISNFIGSKVNELNKEFSVEVISLLGHKQNVIPYIERNDFVVGLGRSAMEGMLLGRPAFIPCKDGTLSLVVEDNVDKHAYYNFAGRLDLSNDDKSKNVKDSKRILEDSSFYKKVSTLSREYVLNNYEVLTVQNKMNDLYSTEIEKIKSTTCLVNRLLLLIKCACAHINGMIKRFFSIINYFRSQIREKKDQLFKSI